MDSEFIRTECERLNNLYGNDHFKPFPNDKLDKFLKMEENKLSKDEQSRPDEIVL
jgi:hypothetical protein